MGSQTAMYRWASESPSTCGTSSSSLPRTATVPLAVRCSMKRRMLISSSFSTSSPWILTLPVFPSAPSSAARATSDAISTQAAAIPSIAA